MVWRTTKWENQITKSRQQWKSAFKSAAETRAHLFCADGFERWPQSVFGIIYFSLMGFPQLSVTMNPHFNSSESCLFFFPCSSSASFHTFSASPRLSFLHLSSSSSLPPKACFLTVSLSRLVMSACANFVLNSLCIQTHLLFKSLLPHIFSFLVSFRPCTVFLRCRRCKAILAITHYPHSVKLF